MFFGVVPVREAVGGILAHTTGAGSARFRKGRVLSAEDTAALEAAGFTQVHIARLEAGDMAEDEAATRIAEASAGPGARAAAAFTGRANLYAEAAGLARIDIERVHQLNELDEAVTIATVEDYEPIEPGQMLATVKIIPFAAPRHIVESGEALLRNGGPLVQVAPYQPRNAGLILTRVADTKDSVLTKTEQAVAVRLAHMGSRIGAVRIVDHDDAAVAAAIAELRAEDCAPILIFGASATVDRLDMIPAGLTRAGGIVEQFGMPVDPGNLLMLGRHDEVPVVGVPGCARSPKLNGFDWVLQRICAGIPVTRRDIARMGAGGLLKEIPSRPMPRDGAAGAGPQQPRRPRVAALILAAGLSRRFGSDHKLLADLDGKPVIRHVVEAALASSARPVILVTGHRAAEVEAAAGAGDLTRVTNPAHAEGLASSLQAGLKALPPEIDGVLVCLGDMPDIRAEVLEKLVAAFNPTEGRAICLPVHNGKRGNPVLWGTQFLPELLRLEGDAGARSLLVPHADWICEVPVDDPGILRDYDTPEMLARRRISET
ncbi:MAG TPA: molybdopterin-binding/glycosyltransferase family 2 protein [Ferrovibrio sp.]|uniref:molybdopterin-binding/glycosyltransferase family 2 protein n=1 Tax=Ferrovibrio sp. TaxID=1917215 RepID=UPI002B4AF756|nr:molybdopterin-binding/glycosyltransferase family 2 protein [Ferrovibrio sp.]HLT78757.1 molybdopterin-binding/glycosyltransferase family 2 protein [Ferrovibrio sp.]